MEFIGRKKDLFDLENQFASNHSFVVLYGRQRIGKTTLIQEFIKNKSALYYLATQENEIQSRKRFSQALGLFTKQEELVNKTFDGWINLFQIFSDFNPEERKVLVIDEFQNLLYTNPDFISIFQKVWDEVLSNKNIMVVLCGSSIDMITNKVLSSNAPLYYTTTLQMMLPPLSFAEIRNYYKKRTFIECVLNYAITGGVPKYLECFDNDNTLTENICQTVLNKNSSLYEEPHFLIDKEFNEPMNYFSILQAISQGNHKVSEIASALQMQANRLSPYLENLQRLSLVDKRTPITENNPENSRKGLYFIKDTFIRFWFKFIFPYKGEIEIGNKDFVLQKIQQNFTNEHVPLSFIEICKETFLTLCQENKIDFFASKIGGYWNKQMDIDLVAIDEDNKRIFLADCKDFSKNNPVGTHIYENLLEKGKNPDFKDYQIIYGLFSRSGFTNKLKEISDNGKDIVLINEGVIL